MPELPEIETVCRGLTPLLVGQQIDRVIVRQPKLRWPVAPQIAKRLSNATISAISRRSKYLLISTSHGNLIWHFGMSGTLRVLSEFKAAQAHDHIDWLLSNGHCLRYTDPRRFGCLLWQDSPLAMQLLAKLGPEPLTDVFHPNYLFTACQGRKRAIKLVIMDSHVVVGVGNIYANESLFRANIHPQTPAGQLTLEQCTKLCDSIKTILAQAITMGGTTLNDFSQVDGKPGYFQQTLQVYGRATLPCMICHTPLQSINLNQRQTVFCPHCQPIVAP